MKRCCSAATALGALGLLRPAFLHVCVQKGYTECFEELLKTVDFAKNNHILESHFTKIIKEFDEWLKYDLPKNLLGKIWKGKYRGQKQKWFIMKFVGETKDINIKTKHPEFFDWKWVEPSKLPDIAVKFKVNIYRKLVEEIASLKQG